MVSSPRREVEVHVSRGSRGEPGGHGYAGKFATKSAFRTLTRSVILTLGSLVRTTEGSPHKSRTKTVSRVGSAR